MFICVISDYFYAGVVLENDVCVESAPILKYMKGKTFNWIKSYCDKNGWEWLRVPQR